MRLAVLLVAMFVVTLGLTVRTAWPDPVTCLVPVPYHCDPGPH